MSFGMNTPVPAPMPVPRPYATALTTYLALDGPEYGPDAKGVKRWLNGVKFRPFGCDKIVGALFDPCVARLSTLNEFGAEVSFDPFLAEVGVTCSTLGYDRPTLDAYVIAHTEVSRSSILGAQVERSAYTTGNPSLASEAQDVSSADTSLAGALYAVEAGLADVLDGAQGMIHLPAGLLGALAAVGGVLMVDGRPMTATGHLIVADAGYLGASPATQALVTGERWIYGSGPVFAKYDDLLRYQTDPWEHLGNGLMHNDQEVKAEIHGIAIFEPCSVVAAKVDISDSDIVN